MDLSQEKVASRLRITPQQLQKYERGVNRIGASRLYEIATILDVPVQYFFQKLPTSREEPEMIDSALGSALEDAATVRLLRLFASVPDGALKGRVLSIVEAVIDRG